MLVWGGSIATGMSAGGARYDPATDSWSPLRLAGGPQRRGGHQAVWTGTEMVMWGGTQGRGWPRGDGARYDPATDTWHAVAADDAPIERDDHADRTLVGRESEEDGQQS